MGLRLHHARCVTRRHFLQRCQMGLGAIALASMTSREARAAGADRTANPLALQPAHFIPRAKSVIYLHMSGGPPQQDLFDWKPKLVEYHMKPCPDELIEGKKFPFIKGHPVLLGSPYKFAQHGQSGAWVSELLPNIAQVADELCVVRSMWTDQFNH